MKKPFIRYVTSNSRTFDFGDFDWVRESSGNHRQSDDEAIAFTTQNDYSFVP